MCTCQCVCVCVDVGGRPFPCVYVPWVYVCLRGEWRGWLCVIYSSVVARCEKDDESFRLPFSNRLDSTGHQAKGKLLYGASALCPIDLCASLLIENHRTGFSFRSDRSIADSSYSESNVSRIIRRSLREPPGLSLAFSALRTKCEISFITFPPIAYP